MNRLQILEQTLEDKIRDLNAKKIFLGIRYFRLSKIENSLEQREIEITKLNFKVNELKEEAKVRKEEFEKQRSK